MARYSSNTTNGNGGNGTRLVYWILGALMALVGALSAIAHTTIMHQLDSLEQRIGGIEQALRK